MVRVTTSKNKANDNVTYPANVAVTAFADVIVHVTNSNTQAPKIMDMANLVVRFIRLNNHMIELELELDCVVVVLVVVPVERLLGNGIQIQIQSTTILYTESKYNHQGTTFDTNILSNPKDCTRRYRL